MFRGGSGTGLGTETRTGEWCLVIDDLQVAKDGQLTTTSQGLTLIVAYVWEIPLLL